MAIATAMEKNVGISLNLLRRNCMNKKTLDVFNTGRREDGVKREENCYNS
jgi:hypothetical protein